MSGSEGVAFIWQSKTIDESRYRNRCPVLPCMFLFAIKGGRRFRGILPPRGRLVAEGKSNSTAIR